MLITLLAELGIEISKGQSNQCNLVCFQSLTISPAIAMTRTKNDNPVATDIALHQINFWLAPALGGRESSSRSKIL